MTKIFPVISGNFSMVQPIEHVPKMVFECGWLYCKDYVCEY